MTYDPRIRRLALALYSAGEARDVILEICAISSSNLDRWRVQDRVPVRRRGCVRDADAIARALDARDEPFAAKVPFVVSLQPVREEDPPAIVGKDDDRSEEERRIDAKRNAKVRSSAAMARHTSDCSCLLCQLAAPNDLYASSSFCVDEKELPTSRNIRPGAR